MPFLRTARWVRRGTTPREKRTTKWRNCWVWGIREGRFSIGWRGFESRTCTREIWADEMKGNALDFSFSGLKTAVLYHVREHSEYTEEIRRREEALTRGERKFEQLLPLCSAKRWRWCGSFRMQWCAIWLNAP